MEYKRDFDGAGLGDHDDGHDAKRVCLPPPDAADHFFDHFSSHDREWAVDDAHRTPEHAWIQPDDKFLPSNLDPERDTDFEQIVTPSIDPQQMTDWSVTIDSTRQSSLVVPSPTLATEETEACEEDQGSEVKEVDTCFGVVGFLQAATLQFE